MSVLWYLNCAYGACANAARRLNDWVVSVMLKNKTITYSMCDELLYDVRS